jgi:hypothetical protein
MRTYKLIQGKISSYGSKDMKKFGYKGNIEVQNVIDLLVIQKRRCYVCNDEVSLEGYLPYCAYQWSVDRINNNKAHDYGNVLISCYYCNCRGYKDFGIRNKVCTRGCHKKIRNNLPTRRYIIKWEGTKIAKIRITQYIVMGVRWVVVKIWGFFSY